MRGYLDVLEDTASGLLDMVHEIIDTIAEAKAVELADKSVAPTLGGFSAEVRKTLEKIK